MKALVIAEAGGPEVLELREVATPAIGAWEVRVAVRATALNRADLLQIRGFYPAPHGSPADIPGLEYAGDVVAVGAQVTRFKLGDRVMGIVGGGAFAEELVTHEREAMRIPEGLSYEQAAAIPEAFLTAYDALVLQGGMRAGENVLVHAVASGVGTAAVQLIHASGARAVGTARSKAKLERMRQELGLEHSVVVGDEQLFADAVRAVLGGEGVHLALELVGGDYLPETLRAMEHRGRVLLVGLMAGASTALDLRAILSKRLQLVGTVLRSRPVEEKIAAAQAMEQHLLPLFRAGKLRPVVDQVVPMTEAQRAFVRLQSNESFGKIVLHW